MASKSESVVLLIFFGLYQWVEFDNELGNAHKNKVIYHANKSSGGEPRAAR